jgi:HSP20 family protein
MELDKFDKFETQSSLQQLLAIRDRIGELSVKFDPDGELRPKVDLLDLGDAYELIVEVPGVPQENLEVAVQGREVIVAGLREPFEEPESLVFSERPVGHFQRSVLLPAEVERERGTAHLREGLLVVHLPKR